MKIPTIIFVLLLASTVFAVDYGSGDYGNDTYPGANSPPTVQLTVSPKFIPSSSPVHVLCEAQDSSGVKLLDVKIDSITQCTKSNLTGQPTFSCSFSYQPEDLTKNHTVVCNATNIFDATAEKTDSFYATKDTGGGGGGGTGAGKPKPNNNTAINATEKNKTIEKEKNKTNDTDTVKPVEEVQDRPTSPVQLNLTAVLDNLGVWTNEVSENVQKYVSESGAVETLQEYLTQATDLPHYSIKAKLLLIFTIISLVFIILKPRDGSEHHVHRIMKRIIVGHKKHEKHREHHPVVHKVSHHAQRIHHAAVHHVNNVISHVKKEKPAEKKFIGKIRFNDGHSEFCYEAKGKDFVCHTKLDKLAEEIKEKVGHDFKNNLTYDVPHHKPRAANFVMLTPKERHDFENLIVAKSVHHVIHKIKHVVKHIAKSAPVVKPKPKPAPKKKRDKYLDLYKKQRKTKPKGKADLS